MDAQKGEDWHWHVQRYVLFYSFLSMSDRWTGLSDAPRLLPFLPTNALMPASTSRPSHSKANKLQHFISHPACSNALLPHSTQTFRSATRQLRAEKSGGGV